MGASKVDIISKRRKKKHIKIFAWKKINMRQFFFLIFSAFVSIIILQNNINKGHINNTTINDILNF